VEDAVGIALKNNYDILVARTSADIGNTNNTPGNAGMLPDIGFGVSDNAAWNNASLEFTSGSTSTSANAHSNAFNTNVALNWTLFDGGKMFITKRKLDQLSQLGEIQFRDKVTQTLYNVIVAYYDIVRQKQQLASINEMIRYNRERVKILQASFNAGLVPKTDLLQSQVDLNVHLENAIIQETVILASKRTLNQWLSRNPETPYEVIDSIDPGSIPDKQALTQKLYANNTQILSYSKQLEVAGSSIKEITAQRYPWISFSALYNFLHSTSTVGTVLRNTTFGPQIGGTLTLPIYYGRNIHRQVQAAKLEFQSAGYALESTRIALDTKLQNAITEHEHEMQLIGLEQKNLLLARENLDISMDRLRLGQTTTLEVRQAEDSYQQSMTRLILFKYSAKVAETRLRQLVAEL
jgi:outer membrane protein TolC